MNFNKEQIATFGKLFSSALFSGGRGTLESKEIEIDAGRFGYQIYLPSKIKNKRDWPLIVFLHGITQRGSGGFLPSGGTYGTFLRQYLAQIPAIVLFPQCRPGSYWSDPVMDEMVMAEIPEIAGEYGINEKRVYLIGVSMGGYGLWHFAFQYPEKFAALVSICGGSSMTAGDRFNPLAEKIGKTPAWLFHGADDKIVQVSESRQIVKAIEAHQGEVKYSEYPNVGHNVWFKALAEKDLIPWLLAQENNRE